MKLNFLPLFILSVLLTSCNNTNQKNTSLETTEIESAKKENTPVFQNKGHELVYAMTQKVGDYNKLLDKKDVVYTYTYETPDGKADVSTENYMFDGELSYGAYTKHERTLPQLEGLIEQGYDGEQFWLKHNGAVIQDEALLKRVAFNRPTNFYWFTMMQKLLDPGVNYEYLRSETIGTTDYEVVKISFTSEENKPTDIYQLYINKDTLLVDQFLFTVADFGKMETPNLMTLTYENVDGLLLPTKRLYKKSTWNADVTDAPWIQVTWSNIKFNNGLTKDDFTIK